jgi:hypothetical protein
VLVTVKLTATKENEINNFLSKFYNTNLNIQSDLTWSKEYKNPIEVSDIIGAYIDNIELFEINMWVILDKDIFIKISDSNANEIIKYLFERYPY